MKVNTNLGVDLKTKLQSHAQMQPGKGYMGVLTRDNQSDLFNPDEHYTFVETIPQTASKRNPHVFDGKYITITRRDDGSLRPNFKPMKIEAGFSIVGYAFGVARELIIALTGLVEEV